MDELISRQELLKKIYSQAHKNPNAYKLSRYAELLALEAPTVDAVPVVHGKWECGKPCPCCGEDRFKGLDADIWADWEPPFCPNCGADMREVEHETN